MEIKSENFRNIALNYCYYFLYEIFTPAHPHWPKLTKLYENIGQHYTSPRVHLSSLEGDETTFFLLFNTRGREVRVKKFGHKNVYDMRALKGLSYYAMPFLGKVSVLFQPLSKTQRINRGKSKLCYAKVPIKSS